MFGFDFLDRRKRSTLENSKSPAGPGVVLISDYIGSYNDSESVADGVAIVADRQGGIKVIRTDVMKMFTDKHSAVQKIFRDAIVGKCDGMFPVTNPAVNNVYYYPVDNKYYKCKTGHTGAVIKPDDKFEEFSLLSISNSKLNKISLTGAAKGSANVDNSGNIEINTTINYNDISGKPSSMKNPNTLVLQLNGKNQTAYDGSTAVTINITPQNIGAQPAGSYAASNHNHDTVYAKISHTHSEYQPKGEYANKIHKHSGSDIENLNGYVKPAETSTIAPTDNLITAIGKLEKGLEGKQDSGNYATIDHNHDDRYASKNDYNQRTLIKRPRLEGKEAISNVNLPDGYYVAHDEMVRGYTDWWNLLSFGAGEAGGSKIQFASPFTHKATTSGGINDSHLFIRVGDKTTWKSDWRKVYTSADFALADLVKDNGGRIRTGVLNIDSSDAALRFNSNNNQAQYIAFYKQGTRKMIFGNGTSNQPNAMMLAGENGAYIDINGFGTINMNVGRLNLGRFFTAGVSGNPVAYLTPDENTTKTLKLHDFGRDPNCYFDVDLGSKGTIKNSKDPVEDADLATKRYVDNKLGTSEFAPLTHTHNWNDITDKPSTFTPSEHNHNGLYNTKTEVTNILKGYSSITHNHDDKYQLKGNYALNNHKHTGADITSLTGYTKAASISTITATDSLLVALGKLEKSLDNKQVAGNYANADHNHNNVYNTKGEITNLLANKLGKTETAASASKLATGRTISVSGAVTGSVVFDGSANTTINTTLSGFDASKITSGIISVDRLPKTALSEFIPVANKEARLKLTKEQAQNGDTVKEADTGKMFLIIDDTKLNADAGYQEYTTVVDWASITGKPSTFTPTAHNHTWAQISDRPTTMASPHGLTISLNGKAQTVYTGAAAVAFNITAASIGAQVAGNYANANHNHNDLYAAISHTHSEYQAKGDYALSNHNHDTVYAPKSHNHNDLYNTKTEITELLKGYSLSTHDHNGVYAPVAHKHDEYQPKGNYQPAGSYALTDHNHSGVYAPVSHSHSEYQPKGSYASADHNHDSSYAAISHTHSEYQPAGSYAAASHTHSYAGSNSAGGDATRALTIKDYMGETNIHVGYGGAGLTASTCKFLAGYDQIADGNVRIKDISGAEARSFIGAAAVDHNHSEYLRTNGGTMDGSLVVSGEHFILLGTRGKIRTSNNYSNPVFMCDKAGSGSYGIGPDKTNNMTIRYGSISEVSGDSPEWAGVNNDFSHRFDGNIYAMYNQVVWHAGNFDPNTKLNTSGGTINGALTVTGQILSNADVVAYSDARFKTNIRVIDTPLEKISKINGYYYDMMGVENEHQVGVLAQELQKVLPEAVFEDKNGHLGVRYTNIVPVLIEGVKQLVDENKQLKDRLDRIEKLLLQKGV